MHDVVASFLVRLIRPGLVVPDVSVVQIVRHVEQRALPVLFLLTNRRKGETMRIARTMVWAMVSIVLSATWASANFQGLGDLPGGSYYSRAYAVSADGSTIVGISKSTASDPFSEAFSWAKESGMVGLGDFPGGDLFSSIATGVSANGSVVVGSGRSASGPEAFCWTSGAGMTGLGDLPGGPFLSMAHSVSADGSVIVGRASSDAGYGMEEAFRWENGVMVGLGGLSGTDWRSYAYDVSADGTVIVGNCGFGSSQSDMEAFRWESGVMTGLGHLPGGHGPSSNAFGISSDGSVIVGYSTSEAADWGHEAFRWEDGVMIGLGDLPGGYFGSTAQATSADGSVIVGSSVTSGATGEEAFIWDELNGMRNLKDVLTSDYGFDLTGWTLTSARGISDDALTIVGYGSNPDGVTEAWIATIPEPATLGLMLLGGLVLLRRKRS